MENITHLFDEVYTPQKALLIYQSQKSEDRLFVEAFDIDSSGHPINAHPLSQQENEALAALLDSCTGMKRDFLKSKGVMPEKVLYIDPGTSGFAVWYTPMQETSLFFRDSLGIPNGKATVPAMIWKANKDSLWVYAIAQKKKPNDDTPLCYAPFFNVYKSGNVCMGSVDIDFDRNITLEEFMQDWEQYFWNSYFSHLNDSFCPVTVNIVQLWQGMMDSGKPFDTKVLIRTGNTLSSIL